VFLISLALAVPAAFLSWHGIERRCRWRRRAPEPANLAPAGVPASG
jgi:peptidoglycan/LPS O-acetylase OafA/YrhL